MNLRTIFSWLSRRHPAKGLGLIESAIVNWQENVTRRVIDGSDLTYALCQIEEPHGPLAIVKGGVDVPIMFTTRRAAKSYRRDQGLVEFADIVGCVPAELQPPVSELFLDYEFVIVRPRSTSGMEAHS